MAKHNKWSKVKRLKAVTDSRRGKVFSRIARDLTMAAKSGGGDPAGKLAGPGGKPVKNVTPLKKK